MEIANYVYARVLYSMERMNIVCKHYVCLSVCVPVLEESAIKMAVPISFPFGVSKQANCFPRYCLKEIHRKSR